MESWRERGFVPDSDEEDEFDSQDLKALNENGNLADGYENSMRGDDGNVPATTSEKRDVEAVSQPEGDLDQVRYSHYVSPDTDAAPVYQKDDAADEGLDEPQYAKTPGDTSQTHHGGTTEPEEDTMDEGREDTHHVAKDDEQGRSASPDLPPLPDIDLPSTPPAKQPDDIFEMPSSSPDVLQFDNNPIHRQSAGAPNTEVNSPMALSNDAGSSSPLSSPPSDIDLDHPDHSDRQQAAEHDDLLEKLLPPLELPEDVVQELNQPARRSLRERNPIQLHPYLLEDAQYQRLMKTRGVKPVHALRHLIRENRPPDDDSQEKEESANVEESLSSGNSGTGRHFPPPSASRSLSGQRHQRRISEPVRQRDTLSPIRASASSQVREPKRRKISHPDDASEHLNRPNSIPQRRTLNFQSTSAEGPEDDTVWDISPSPPRSGSIASSQTTHVSGFRFPRGLTPPVMTTPITEPTPNANAAGGSNMNWTDPGTAQNPVDVDSDSPGAESDNDAQNDSDGSEVVVRQLQRKIKGVLPASWLRLDLKQNEKRADPHSRNRDAASSHRQEDARGVAKKVTRPNYSARSNSREPLTSTMRLFDHEDDDDDGDRNDAEDGSVSEDNSREELARLFGFDDPVHDQMLGDGDIPEDNRIDGMFPPVPRGSVSPRGQRRGVKRQRPQQRRPDDPNPWKRSRLKRQSRITDPIYGGQRQKRQKRRSPKPPSLGVLDAPDVAKQPRKKQPQFLRIAARQARSRRDGGRRSPNRKFLRLSSGVDTEDANASLREWRRGNISRAKPTESRSRPQMRTPLIDLSANEPNNNRQARRPSVNYADERAILSGQENAAGNVSNTGTSARAQSLRTNETDKRPVRREQQGNKWVIRRNLAVSSLKRNAPRPAVPEISTADSTSLESPALFHKSLSMLNRNYHLSKGSQRRNHKNVALDRFLSDSVSSAPLAPPHVPVASTEGLHGFNDTTSKSQLPARPRQMKKRPPNRVDLNAIVADNQPPLESLYPQDPEPPPSVHLSVAEPEEAGGLTSFQRSYSLDFNTVPTFAGTFFHESTFLGSGEFARSLQISLRDLDKDAGRSTVHFGDRNLLWGAWNDTVSSELGTVFDMIAEDMRIGANPRDTISGQTDRQSVAAYRSVVEYATHVLYFIDPIDRAGFVRRALDLVCKLNECIASSVSFAESNRGYIVRVACYNLVFTNQVYQIACHDLVDAALGNEALELVKTVSRMLIMLIVCQAGLKEIRQFLNENKKRERREAGAHGDDFTVEAFVVVRHVLRSTDMLKGCFETLVADAVLSDLGDVYKSKDVSQLENGWHSVFTTLPLNELDRFGITNVGSRFRERHDNWPMVKRLLQPVLSGYSANLARPIPFNNYCRVLFHRCFYLINSWGWRDCKIILDTLFDFFARNTLYNLSHEETFGSPSFLEELDRNPSLDVRPGESCFHIFLKIVGRGLRFLSDIYDAKKIRNFAWRLLPNHGRVYPKEKPLRHEDLDALRNHHDLLCTLYWAVPEGCRPRLEAIRNLVHPATSHRETCNISLRSWARLARFKLSTHEDVSGLDPFADWHSYFVAELVKQHSLARIEIESQSKADSRFSRQMIEGTISQNQRQIESLLKTGLSGMKDAVQLAPSLEHARMLVHKMPVKAVLGLFNPRNSRVNTVVSEALQVIVAYVQKIDVPAAATNVSASADEDTQEYGDWSDIEAMCGQELSAPDPGIEHVEKVFHPAVARLVSNCFGEDQCPEDEILFNVVNCWTSIARALVSRGLRHWDSYVGHYDADSWATLRTTVQTRKFTPYFLASCIDKDNRILSESNTQVLGVWMSVMVERTSMLKFQHRLTEALLNQDSENPILKNLPFWTDRISGRFTITLEDFSQRRLSLISSILSNMREHLLNLEDAEATQEYWGTKQEYKELVERLMASMKANYQELGNGAAESAQGAYVDFVQCVVGFLQQYARDISPIDPFFTDPVTFPLPSTDPTYIVARLKSYEPKLSAEKVARTLIIFIQGVSERAAIDDQQVYLVDQLCASMADTYESGNPNRPTLRAVLLQCIFPAYLEIAFSNGAAWILCRPILQTVSLTFKDLLFNMDATDPTCVLSVVDMFRSIFSASYQALLSVVDDPELLREPTVLLTASSFVEMITSALPVIDYIDRVADGAADADTEAVAVTNATQKLIEQTHAFRHFALFVITHLRTPIESTTTAEPSDPRSHALSFSASAHAFSTTTTRSSSGDETTPALLQDARHLASRELRTYVHESWSRHNGRYYFTRRGKVQPREVGVDPPLVAALESSPERVLGESAGVFLDVVCRLGLVDDGFD